MKRESAVDFGGVQFRIVRRQVKYTRIIYRKKDPVAIIPPGVSPRGVFEQNRERITRKIDAFRQAVQEAARLKVWHYSPEKFDSLLAGALADHSRYLGVEVREVKLRKMKRRWGTCYSDGKIILNRTICLLPPRLISFIVFHELLHMRFRNHGREFREAIRRRFPDYRDINRSFRLYGLRLLGD